jgi:hypothetical protein
VSLDVAASPVAVVAARRGRASVGDVAGAGDAGDVVLARVLRVALISGVTNTSKNLFDCHQHKLVEANAFSHSLSAAAARMHAQS